VPDLKKAAVLEFNEVISERPSLTLDQMVLLSPRPRNLSVSWHRTSIDVKPKEGWQPGVVYRLTLLPGISDLRSNKQPAGKTVVFSTGGAIPATSLAGRVIDWEAGSAGARALVEAVRTSDSTVFWDVADSTGKFNMVAVPPGQYVFSATLDRNTNRRRDYHEPYDSIVVTLDSTVSNNFWTFVHDTVGPRIRTVTRSDSVTAKVEFNQSLGPAPLDSTAVVVLEPPDSTRERVDALMTDTVYDSVQTAARQAQAKTDTAAANRRNQPAPGNRPPAAPAPTQPSAFPGRQPGAPGFGAPRPGFPGAQAPAPPDSALVKLLRERPRLSTSLVVRTANPLKPGGRYVFKARVANPSGAVAESNSVLVIPAPTPVDTTKRKTR